MLAGVPSGLVAAAARAQTEGYTQARDRTEFSHGPAASRQHANGEAGATGSILLQISLIVAE